jgi:hypothetical protein
VSLAFAASALGAYSPKLQVTHTVNAATGAGTTDVSYIQTDADDPPAHVQILAPIGFSATLTQAVGTQIGTLEGSVVAGAFGGATVPVAGTIVVGDASNATIKATAKACTQVETHAAVWLLNVTAAGQSLPAPVPVFVDPVSTAPLNAFASASIQLCLPAPPDASFQIKLLSATLHVSNVFAPPATPGEFRWTAINTPYKADKSVNLAGTVETQAIDRTPVNATIATKRTTKTRTVKHKTYKDIFYSYTATVSGQVMAGGQPASGVSVDIMSGEDKLTTVTTDNSGNYKATFKLTKTAAYHAVASEPASALTGASCVPPLPLGPGAMPCASVTGSGFTVTTGERTVTKPKLTHKRIKIKPKKKPKH